MVRSVLSRTSHFLIAGVLAAAFGWAGVTASSARADSGSLVGSWSGSGSIAFASGSEERARCHAHYAKTGASSYAMNATCATASAKVEQTATLYRSGARSYSGTFFNQQYNTGGQIRITVSGRHQSVHLSGEAGTASFSLRKL